MRTTCLKIIPLITISSMLCLNSAYGLDERICRTLNNGSGIYLVYTDGKYESRRIGYLENNTVKKKYNYSADARFVVVPDRHSSNMETVWNVRLRTYVANSDDNNTDQVRLMRSNIDTNCKDEKRPKRDSFNEVETIMNHDNHANSHPTSFFKLLDDWHFKALKNKKNGECFATRGTVEPLRAKDGTRIAGFWERLTSPTATAQTIANEDEDAAEIRLTLSFGADDKQICHDIGPVAAQKSRFLIGQRKIQPKRTVININKLPSNNRVGTIDVTWKYAE